MARRTCSSLYGRVHGVATRVLSFLWRSASLERAGLGLVSALLRGSLRRLRAHPAVERVLIRGSYLGERFNPLLSDIDIVVWLHGSGAPPFDRLVSFLDRLRTTRRLDPSLRDEWQFLIGALEWPLLERHGGLLEMDRWCDETGRRPFRNVPPPSPRLQLAHDWRRHDQWTETAMRFGLPRPGQPADGVRFAACEKKASVLAARLLGRAEPSRRRPPPRSTEEFLDRAASLLALRDRCASRVFAEIESPRPLRLSVPTNLPSDTRLLDVAAAIGETWPLAAVLWQAGVACVVTTEALDEGDWVGILRRIDECGPIPGARSVPYSQRVFSLGAPLLPRRTVTAAPALRSGSAEPMQLLLLREQLFCEALFVGADLRILANRPAPAEGPPLITDKLACFVSYFALGVFVPQGGGALEALHRAGRVEEIPPSGSSPARWYELNTALFAQLVEVLSTDPVDAEARVLESSLRVRE